jgi:hypothetical protein
MREAASQLRHDGLISQDKAENDLRIKQVTVECTVKRPKLPIEVGISCPEA